MKPIKTYYTLYDTVEFGQYKGKTVYEVIHRICNGYSYILWVQNNTVYKFADNILKFARIKEHNKYRFQWLAQ